VPVDELGRVAVFGLLQPATSASTVTTVMTLVRRLIAASVAS
jgi:hypothetical protein